jgi:hypothetical protein
MNKELLAERWKREEEQPFSGWDFSYLDNRMLEEQHDWSYSARAIELLKQSSSVIDLDTGGGERFMELREHWPPIVVATENYEPNFKLATERLGPLGVKVFQIHVSDFDLHLMEPKLPAFFHQVERFSRSKSMGYGYRIYWPLLMLSHNGPKQRLINMYHV